VGEDRLTYLAWMVYDLLEGGDEAAQWFATVSALSAIASMASRIDSMINEVFNARIRGEGVCSEFEYVLFSVNVPVPLVGSNL